MTDQIARIAAGGGALVGLGYLARRTIRRRRRWSFTGRTVVITGGSRGLGLEIARLVGGEGAHVVLLARDRDELDRAAAELGDRGVAADAYICDVTDRQTVQDVITVVHHRTRRLDAIFNVAGIVQVGPLETMDLEDFRRAMDVHFWGSLHTVWAALPILRRQGYGRIVNISSVGGRVAVPHMAPYCASKFALTGLSDALRAELAQDGIRVTTVTPGLMRTGSHVNAQFKGDRSRESAWFSVLAASPLTSASARRSARRIVEAARHGDPALTITVQARMLVAANALVPGLTAWGMRQGNRILPEAAGDGGGGDGGGDREDGRESRPASEQRSRSTPSVLTWLADRAARRNNELGGATG
ncbi:MAG: SDR family oxidoreductase [Candidatus Krumholzibacteriia bacterium]